MVFFGRMSSSFVLPPIVIELKEKLTNKMYLLPTDPSPHATEQSLLHRHHAHRPELPGGLQDFSQLTRQAQGLQIQ